MSLMIKEVTGMNWRAAAALQVTEAQRPYMESNAFSLAESKYEYNATSVCLYDGIMLVGYAMYGWYCEESDSLWIERFMIDAEFQGRGYGRQFFPLLLDYLHQRFHYEKVMISIHPEDRAGQRFAQSLGFRSTGETDDVGTFTGQVMELDVEPVEDPQPWQPLRLLLGSLRSR
ncbi:GNAT family N-acetyltransferase [Paenibacillus shenyangensis]|uniref:GNAT family N-acetyltransferase n=1 Tax=Paenibacillus sp. A9 TaxID=1284352 RepID=UPI0003750ADD|nr:GNAT family N-acetyltransferase [Paenibacillus sp. A9]